MSIKRDDLISCDVHKWFNVTMSAGTSFCPDRDLLAEAFRPRARRASSHLSEQRAHNLLRWDANLPGFRSTSRTPPRFAAPRKKTYGVLDAKPGDRDPGSPVLDRLHAVRHCQRQAGRHRVSGGPSRETDVCVQHPVGGSVIPRPRGGRPLRLRRQRSARRGRSAS
jgi:hypothetical protein